jgi:hypothetical protein
MNKWKRGMTKVNKADVMHKSSDYLYLFDSAVQIEPFFITLFKLGRHEGICKYRTLYSVCQDTNHTLWRWTLIPQFSLPAQHINISLLTLQDQLAWKISFKKKSHCIPNSLFRLDNSNMHHTASQLKTQLCIKVENSVSQDTEIRPVFWNPSKVSLCIGNDELLHEKKKSAPQIAHVSPNLTPYPSSLVHSKRMMCHHNHSL